MKEKVSLIITSMLKINKYICSKMAARKENLIPICTYYINPLLLNWRRTRPSH